MEKLKKHALVGGLCILFGGFTFSLPYLIKSKTPNIVSEGKVLTGSQRMRGMYMNAGSSDAGPDPDWENGEYRGRENKEKRRQQRLNSGSSSEQT